LALGSFRRQGAATDRCRGRHGPPADLPDRGEHPLIFRAASNRRKAAGASRRSTGNTGRRSFRHATGPPGRRSTFPRLDPARQPPLHLTVTTRLGRDRSTWPPRQMIGRMIGRMTGARDRQLSRRAT